MKRQAGSVLTDDLAALLQQLLSCCQLACDLRSDSAGRGTLCPPERSKRPLKQPFSVTELFCPPFDKIFADWTDGELKMRALCMKTNA